MGYPLKEHLPTRVGTDDIGGRGFAPHTGFHTSEYADLSATALTPETASRTCGPYRYTVTTSGHTPHTAFRTRAHLDQWLGNLGLSLIGDFAEGSGECLAINGRYRVTSHRSYDEFFVKQGKRIRHMDNADYTLGILERDEDGVVNVHHLNCNLMDRPVFDPKFSRELVG